MGAESARDREATSGTIRDSGPDKVKYRLYRMKLGSGTGPVAHEQAGADFALPSLPGPCRGAQQQGLAPWGETIAKQTRQPAQPG
jgi:hypothetical protein